MSRYVVRELEGFWRLGAGFGNTKRRAGVSVYVMDSECGYRVLKTWRTEQRGGQITGPDYLAAIRAEAAALARAWNREEASC